MLGVRMYCKVEPRYRAKYSTSTYVENTPPGGQFSTPKKKETGTSIAVNCMHCLPLIDYFPTNIAEV